MRAREAVWRNVFVTEAKTRIQFVGWLDLIFTAFLIGLFFVARVFGAALDFFPAGFFSYGLLIHIPHAIWWIIPIAVGASRSIELVAFLAVGAFILLLLDVWAVVIFIRWFIGCIRGDPLSSLPNCIMDPLFQFPLLVISIAYVVIDFVILITAISLYRYLRTYDERNTLAPATNMEKYL